MRSILLRSRTVFWSILVLITLAGFAIRNHDIASIPSGLFPDEAMNGTNALEANRTGEYKLFYTDNFGREGLFINLQALAIRAFGNTIPALKIWSVIFGSLAALGTGLLAWELFRSRYAAIVASFLVATSYWAINFSRIGFRAIMVPFLLSFSFFFLFRGIRIQRFLPFALSGLLFGLGLHTYVAFRLAPFILILLFPFLLLSYPSFLRTFWKYILTFIVCAGISAAPMFYAFLTQPEIFSSRSSAISIFSPEVNKGNLLGTLGKTVGLSLIKYNFIGDQNWRHNYPPYPLLDPIIGISFLSGFLFSIWMFFRIFMTRIRTGRTDSELATHAFLLVGFLVMLAPEFLTDEGLPHALRAIGTQPFVFAFATIPLVFLFRKASRSGGGTKVALAITLMLIFSVSAVWNVSKYFLLFANRPEQHAAFSESYKNMADYLISLPEETKKYVVPEYFVAVQPIVFLTDGKVRNLELVNSETVIRTPAVILQQRYDARIFENIHERMPSSYERIIDLKPGFGSQFTAIFIP
ncbi:MAG: hypothetical protein HGB34_00490 [Candidatus Moranbacteria bacterium]|nr:hypothetical protein [Candidatus Moranbacteria bacterium]NTW75373.1 hypothetical protein [Candidatus Moranbacteria bacterium]